MDRMKASENLSNNDQEALSRKLAPQEIQEGFFVNNPNPFTFALLI